MLKYFFILSFILTLGLSAEQNSNDSVQNINVIPKSWFQFGAGVIKSHTFYGGNLFFRATEDIAVGIRSCISVEINSPFINPWESFWDVTPTIAYTPLFGSSGMVSALLGIGLVGGTRRGEFLSRQGLVVDTYEKIVFRRLCFAFEIDLVAFIPGTRGLGLVSSVFTNVNSERIFSGYYVGIQLRETR